MKVQLKESIQRWLKVNLTKHKIDHGYNQAIEDVLKKQIVITDYIGVEVDAVYVEEIEKLKKK